MNITEKILGKHSGKTKVQAGDNIWVNADVLMTHDVFGPDLFRTFWNQFGKEAKIWDKNRFALIPDHYIFTKDQKANANIEFLDKIADEYSLPHYYKVHSDKYSGVCHITLAEEGFNIPGGVLFGTDSHSCTSGAFGMFSTGIGLTEGAFILGTGKLWLKVPQAIRVVLDGKMPKYLMAKDLILNLIGDIGVDGGTYKTIEFCGSAIEEMSMEERMTLCNMVVEAGGKNGVIKADSKTLAYPKSPWKFDYEILESDASAKYCLEKIYDVSKMEPIIAKPHSPDNKARVSEIVGEQIDRAYIGSCTGGKIEDFMAAAEIIYGGQVKIETNIVPATRFVESQIKTIKYKDKTLYDIFVEAGCKIGESSCAACLGGPMDTFGRAKATERIISTTNRNFPGRMGDIKSFVYLASPYTVAASALTGKIADARDWF